MRAALRLAALSLTALALLATSTSKEPSCPEGPLVPGPVQLDVETTCGAPGTVTATVDPATCAITLSGAEAVGLPAEGTSDGSGFTLREEGARSCECKESAPGEYGVRCYRIEGGGGCGGGYLPECDGTMRIAAAP